MLLLLLLLVPLTFAWLMRAATVADVVYSRILESVYLRVINYNFRRALGCRCCYFSGWSGLVYHWAFHGRRRGAQRENKKKKKGKVTRRI